MWQGRSYQLPHRKRTVPGTGIQLPHGLLLRKTEREAKHRHGHHGCIAIPWGALRPTPKGQARPSSGTGKHARIATAVLALGGGSIKNRVRESLPGLEGRNSEHPARNAFLCASFSRNCEEHEQQQDPKDSRLQKQTSSTLFRGRN